MNTKELSLSIQKNYQDFIAVIEPLDKETFETSINNKWTPGQQALHQYLALKPLAQALGVYPKLTLKMLGKSKNPLRTYEELVLFYENTLSGKESLDNSKYEPSKVEFSKKESLVQKIQKQSALLLKGIDKFSEEELSTMLLPHPLLGKIPIKEMLYFTRHHVAHHTLKTKENLSL